MGPVWRVEMLGTFQAKSQDLTVSRFRTRRVAALLAFLSLHRNRLHFRDEIGEMLWPESDLQVSRRNLRQALLSLRHALEPPPLPSGSVLQVAQSRLQLNPEVLTTDISEFEDLIDKARETKQPEKRFDYLKQAISLYRGELLPGFDELWVLNERLRMEDLYISSLSQLIEECERLGRTDEAIDFLRLALAKEPLTEAWHTGLMRQYLKSGRPTSALKQYAELETMLVEQLHCQPDHESKELAARAQREAVRGAAIEIPEEASANTQESVQEPSKEQIRLPIQLTRLFGRKAEIDFVFNHFMTGASRLLTITGSAGTGKTRLSVEVGRALAEEGDWNIWFIPLADIDDAALILDRVLDTIKPKKRDRGNPIEQIRDVLEHDKSLLILDNFEHILEGGAPVVGQLLEGALKIRCLVTSRQSLKLEGEHEFALDPLPTPKTSDYETADQLADLAEYPSIQMFVDRCQAIRPDVQLTLNNARHFATICSKLEGIPLAIEIAAGLSNSFAPAQMVKHLENRLTALTSRRRDITPRHRSLRVAIDYGYGFLSPKLQRFFAALSIFRGGFTIESAYEVCYRWLSEDQGSGKRGALEGCLSTVLDLQDRSLLRSEEDDGSELRFRMLETFREYGEERLSDADYATLQERHALYYLATSLPENVVASGEARAQQHVKIESDYNNYIAALEYLFQKRQIADCIRLLSTLSTVWDVRGTKSIEQNYIRQISRLPEIEDVEPTARIQLLRMLGTTYLRNSDFRAAYQACSEALEVALATGIDEQIAACYFGMALCAGYLGEADECIELCQRVLKHAPSSNGVLLERTYVSIGSAQWSRDELSEAEEAFSQARQISKGFRDGEPDALILAHLAGVYLDQGRFDEAMTVAGEGIRISRRLRNEISLSACLSQVARYHRLKKNLPAAVATSHEALLKGRDVAITMLCLDAIRGHALILADMDEFEAATTLIAATQGLATMEKVMDRRESGRALERVHSQISPETYERAWAHGLAMDIDEAFKLALKYK
jgi:predicted ATPase/DNA-binding SARP family transcriptional activator